MADSTWTQQVRQVGEGRDSRADRALTGRTAYLKRRVDAAEFGQAVFAHDVTLDPDVLEGQPVYWNDETERFELALEAVETDPESNALVPAASADCLGVVYAKEFPNKGSVLLFGYAPLDVTNAAGADAPAGRYYLSSAEAGKLVRRRGAVGVSVLFYDGRGKVFVQPTLKDFVEDHIHYSFELAAKPAGETTPPETGERHVIAAPDVTARGWLPAAAFGSRAPAGAKFGYNLDAHPALQRVWPPTPLESVALFMDSGETGPGVTMHLGGDEIIQYDRNGIWWLADCYGQVPWPVGYGAPAAYQESSSGSSGSSRSSATDDGCSVAREMKLVLVFTRMAFATDKSVVTSLQPDGDSPIRLVDCDGNEAKTGDLAVRFVSDFLISDNDADGNLAVKDLDGNKFKRGYVVQGVLSGNDNLTITGTRTKKIGEKTYHQGLLELSVNLDPAARDLPTQVVRLDDVKERFYQDVMYLGMPAGQESTVRAKIKVPGAGLPASPQVKLRVQLLGRATGTLPALAVTYRTLARPTGAAVALPTVDTALTFDSGQAVTTDTYVEVESEAFDVAAGDTVLFTVGRESDGYSGEVGLLDVVGVLFAGG